MTALQKRAAQRKKDDPLPAIPAEPSVVEKRNTPKRLTKVETMRGRDEVIINFVNGHKFQEKIVFK